MSHPVRLLAFLILMTLPAFAPAQTGPSDPQIIASANTARMSLGSRKLAGRLVATLRVGEDGRVRNVQITENTTDPGLEAQAIKVFQSARFRPAIDASGRLIEANASIKLELRASTGDSPKPASADSDPQVTEREKARIRNMHCADFIWEYDWLHEQVADKDAVMAEFMPRISISMYAAARSEAGDRVDGQVWKAAPRGLRTAVEQCRENPQAVFWQDTLKRILDEAVSK